MFNFFKSNPLKKLQLEYEKLLGEAMLAQRKGDIETYSTLSTEADKLLKQIESLKAKSNN